MIKLYLKVKPQFKISKRYLEKLNRFSLSYSQLINQYNVESLDKKISVGDYSKPTLDEVLLDQIEDLMISESNKKELAFMVEELDDKGFFSEWDKTQKKLSKKFNWSPEVARERLRQFQSLEPEGVGARSVSEFLIIQVKRYGLEDKNLKSVVLKILNLHEDEWSKPLSDLAKRLKLNKEEIEKGIWFIRKNLNPVVPAKQYASKKTETIIPSAQIYVDKGKLKVKVLENYDFVEQADIRKDLNQRKKILDEILNMFCQKQSIEILRELGALMPLTQKEIAEKMNLSSSFLSRLVNRKYVLIEQKPYLLRKLFQIKIKGTQTTRYYVRNIIKIQHNKTDKEIQNVLKEKGISISRRMISYYRHSNMG